MIRLCAKSIMALSCKLAVLKLMPRICSAQIVQFATPRLFRKSNWPSRGGRILYSSRCIATIWVSTAEGVPSTSNIDGCAYRVRVRRICKQQKIENFCTAPAPKESVLKHSVHSLLFVVKLSSAVYSV